MKRNEQKCKDVFKNRFYSKNFKRNVIDVLQNFQNLPD